MLVTFKKRKSNIPHKRIKVIKLDEFDTNKTNEIDVNTLANAIFITQRRYRINKTEIFQKIRNITTGFLNHERRIRLKNGIKELEEEIEALRDKFDNSNFSIYNSNSATKQFSSL